MKILVSGGTGYIGSHTVVELIDSGFDVVIVDNLSNSQEDVLKALEEISGKSIAFEKFDLCDRDRCFKFFQDHNDIEGVIHFAAYKAVGESVAKPLKYYHNNLSSLLNILDGMSSIGCQNIVFSSSCTVYGQPEKLPVSENAPVQKAMSPYGNTKQISEEIINDTAATSELRAILLRYFNPIGAHESALIGELPLGVPNNLMPFITQTAIGKRDVLSVFGDDYATPDGTAIRDYIHVVDLADAHVVALQRMLKKVSDDAVEIFNLGTGKGFSVLEVINSFERTSGLRLNYKIVGRRAGDVEQVYADTAYANKVLGWKAKRSLDEMTLSAWKWEQAMVKK